MKHMKLPVPAIHSNGSGAPHLTQQTRLIYLKLQDVLSLMKEYRPHGRDYYTLEDGALEEAQAAHREMEMRVDSVAKSYLNLGKAIQKAKR